MGNKKETANRLGNLLAVSEVSEMRFELTRA